MFTVKFYREDTDGVERWEHISCPRYSVDSTPHFCTIVTCYKDMAGGTGTEFHISQDDWHACFVENSTGKTVDKHRAQLES